MTNYYIEIDGLIKKYSNDKEKLLTTLKFQPQYQGLEIQETERPLAPSSDGTCYLFADSDAYLQEQAEKEAERISMLNLTAADVERAIYKVKGMDFDDIISYLEAQPLALDGTPQIDIKALKIELKANNFYRGNPYVNKVGKLLGFSDVQMDEFFETGDYTKLLPKTEDAVEESV